jgi:hypothetical protein
MSIPVCGSFTACFVNGRSPNVLQNTTKHGRQPAGSSFQKASLLYGFSQGVVMLVVAVAASTGEGGGEGGGDVGG